VVKTAPASTTSTTSTTAYSYIRFSNAEQARGDSLRRQTNGRAERFCQRHGLTLDTTLSLRDLGVSAFRGRHRSDKHDLGHFLELVKRGKVPRGSYLIIENLDRLSREDERTALRLWMDILDGGVNIVQLEPETIFRHEKSDMFDIMRAIMELARGHNESVVKSQRVADAWTERRKAAQAGQIITRRRPAWLEEEGGAWRLLPGPAAAIRRIYALAAAGYGHGAILVRLAKEKIPPFGDTDRWVRSYVAKLLKDRRVLGEYQPRRRDRSPEGPVIANYFPAVITEEGYQAARAGVAQRRAKPGRSSKHINMFSGLLRSARDGGTYVVVQSYAPANRGGRDKGQRVLKNTASIEARAKCYTFPFLTFESAVLRMLREIGPGDVLGEEEQPDQVKALSGERDRVDAELAQVTAFMDREGFSPTLGTRAQTLDRRLAELDARLAEARREAANPLGEAWDDTKSLLDALNASPDPEDTRLRLRAAMRRIVSEIWILVVPRGHDRLAAVQIWFTGGQAPRNYLILHRPPKANGSARQPGGWWARALAEVTKDGGLDLRDPGHARELEADLLAVEIPAC
jgi:DNA invertase Pin-like site-specific DNA recombinase